MTEDKFYKFVEAPQMLQLYILTFLRPSELNDMGCSSKTMSQLCVRDSLWRHFLIEEEGSTDKRSVFRDFPERRLHRYFLGVPGIKGAELCIHVLKRDPDHLEARSRFDYLLGMGEVIELRTDPVEDSLRLSSFLEKNNYSALLPSWRQTPKLLWDRNKKNPQIEIEYYFAKILLYHNKPEGNRVLLNLLKIHKKHGGALCEVAELIVQKKIAAQETNFMFNDSKPSRRGRARALYFKAIRDDPKYENQALCGLAHIESERKSDMAVGSELFKNYTVLLNKPGLEHDTTRYPKLTWQIATLLLRKVLAQDPYNAPAIFSLVKLLNKHTLPWQRNDFLPKEEEQPKSSALDLELILYGRIRTQSPKTQAQFEKIKDHETTKHTLSQIPRNLWPPYFWNYLNDFQNLPQEQRERIAALLKNAVIPNSHPKTSHFNKLLGISIFCLAQIPILLAYMQAHQLEALSTEALAKVAAVHFAFIFIIFGASLTYSMNIEEEKNNPLQNEEEQKNKAQVDAIKNDDFILKHIFPNWNEEKGQLNSLKRLLNTPLEATDLLSILSIQATKALHEEIEAIQSRNLSDSPTIKRAQYAENTLKALPILSLLTFAGCVMYETSKIMNQYSGFINPPLAAAITVILVTEAIISVLFSIPIINFSSESHLGWHEKAAKSEEDALIQEACRKALP